MGQYWYPVNLDKHEYVYPHRLATGLKLWEQLANHPGTGAALLVLCAAMPEPRGGGDLALDGGNEDVGYQHVARRTIGRWAGDRVALIGDYAEEGDLPGFAFVRANSYPGDASDIYSACSDGEWLDVTDDVRRVIEHELEGQFTDGPGWATWRPNAEGE